MKPKSASKAIKIAKDYAYKPCHKVSLPPMAGH